MYDGFWDGNIKVGRFGEKENRREEKIRMIKREVGSVFYILLILKGKVE